MKYVLLPILILSVLMNPAIAIEKFNIYCQIDNQLDQGLNYDFFESVLGRPLEGKFIQVPINIGPNRQDLAFSASGNNALDFAGTSGTVTYRIGTTPNLQVGSTDDILKITWVVPYNDGALITPPNKFTAEVTGRNSTSYIIKVDGFQLNAAALNVVVHLSRMQPDCKTCDCSDPKCKAACPTNCKEPTIDCTTCDCSDPKCKAACPTNCKEPTIDCTTCDCAADSNCYKSCDKCKVTCPDCPTGNNTQNSIVVHGIGNAVTIPVSSSADTSINIGGINNRITT